MLLKYDVEAKKLDKTKEYHERMRKIEEDAKKQKIEREASFYNAQINDLKKQNEELHEQSEALKNENTELSKNNTELSKSNTELSKSNTELNDEVESKKMSVKILDDKIEYKQSVLDSFKKKMNLFTESVFSYIKTFFNSYEVEELAERKKVSTVYHSFSDDDEKQSADNFIDKTAENLSDKNAAKLRSIKLLKP